MKGVMKKVLLAASIACVLSSLYGCALRPRAKFSLLGSLPPEAVGIKQPSEVKVMTDVPLAGKPYIELGYITVDEGWVSPVIAATYSTEDIIEMVRRKAAECGADAVIKFSIEGERPGHRKAKGIAIVYKKYGY